MSNFESALNDQKVSPPALKMVDVIDSRDMACLAQNDHYIVISKLLELLKWKCPEEIEILPSIFKNN